MGTADITCGYQPIRRVIIYATILTPLSRRQLFALMAFAYFRWSSIVPGGTLTVLKRGLSSSQAWWTAPITQGIESGLRKYL